MTAILNETELMARLSKIKLIVSDFDGVLTAGGFYLDQNGGELFSKFNIHDGFAIIMAQKCALKVAIISGRKSLCTEARHQLLNAYRVITGALDKKTVLQQLMVEGGFLSDEVIFIGDDWIDLAAMQLVAVKVAPADAVSEVIERCNYITHKQGGHGVLREVVELVLKSQGKHADLLAQYLE